MNKEENLQRWRDEGPRESNGQAVSWLLIRDVSPSVFRQLKSKATTGFTIKLTSFHFHTHTHTCSKYSITTIQTHDIVGADRNAGYPHCDWSKLW